jgi:PKD repeat protein
MSPTGISALRLVLNWGARPRDLDAHLWTPAADPAPYEVFYAAGHRGSTNSPPYAQLDVDQTAGFGPETITIARWVPGTYRYFVENYKAEQGDTGELTNSLAVVQIYTDQGLLQTIVAPTVGVGDYWEVCDVEGSSGAITVINSIQATKPAPPANVGSGQTPASQPSNQPQRTGQLSYYWTFGDGTSSQDANPIKTYETLGLYTVSLTAIGANDQGDSVVKTNAIQVLYGGPWLTVQREGIDIVIAWSTNETGFNLESTQDLSSGQWTAVPQTSVTTQGTDYTMRTAAVGNQFYRLKKR